MRWLILVVCITQLVYADDTADGRFTQKRIAVDCDRTNLIQAVHVNIDFVGNTNQLNTFGYFDLCLYSTDNTKNNEPLARLESCNSLKRTDETQNSNTIDGAIKERKGLWYHEYWWNGRAVCDITDQFEIKGKSGYDINYNSMFIVVEGTSTSHVLYADTGYIVREDLHATPRAEPYLIPMDAYKLHYVVKDFGRKPYVDATSKVAQADEIYLITSTSGFTEWDSKFPGQQLGGLSIYEKGNFMNNPLTHRVKTTKFKYKAGYSDTTKILNTESNMHSITLKDVVHFQIEASGADVVTFDKIMVLIKSQGYWYVPVCDTETKYPLSDNAAPSSETENKPKKAKIVLMKTKWQITKKTATFTPNVFGGYWKYKQRIDSNSGGLTYTKTKEDTKTETDETSKETTNTVESGWSMAATIELCITKQYPSTRHQICGHGGLGGGASAETGSSREMVKKTTVANIQSDSCSTTIACTAPSHVKVEELARLDATSLACYAFQWISFAWDTESKQTKEVETCSFVVLDKYGNAPQCLEDDCDDTTDCQKCMQNEPASNTCPLIFGIEYTIGPLEELEPTVVGKEIGTNDDQKDIWCAELCFNAEACRSWTYIQNRKTCWLLNTFRALPKQNPYAISGGPCIKKTEPINCQGAWGECIDGKQKYHISVEASNQGSPCIDEQSNMLTQGQEKECTNYDYVFLFEGMCAGKAQNYGDAIANPSGAQQCADACSLDSNCISFSIQYESDTPFQCVLYESSGENLIVRGGSLNQNFACYQKVSVSEEDGNDSKHCWLVMPFGCNVDKSGTTSNVKEWFLDEFNGWAGTNVCESRRVAWENECTSQAKTCYAVDPNVECWYISSKMDKWDDTVPNIVHEGNICKIDVNAHYTGENLAVLKHISSTQKCANECAQNPRCASWTYVKTGEHAGNCNIKAEVDPDGSANTCCDSGSACFRALTDKELDFDIAYKDVHGV